jgi:tetratricopeptide (TPR) repeat protein
MTLTIRFIFILFALLTANCTSKQDCKDGLNLLPMYGGQKKCDEQLNIDKDFFAECDLKFKDRKRASKFYTDKGWEYFYKNDFETSMKRFNQAWLLDTLNADTYWGFGNILGTRKQFKESISLFEKSISLYSTNPKVFESISTSFGQIFFETKDIKYLNSSIDNLKTSIRLDSQNARAYGQLTGAYSYFMEKDSALKYLKLTDKLDPNAVNPEVRQMLTKK